MPTPIPPVALLIARQWIGTSGRRIILAGAAGLAVLAASSVTAGTQPATAPALVGERVISTPDYESSPTLSRDGVLFFAKRGPVGYLWTICRSVLRGGAWMPPEIADFSGRYSDTDPFATPDGARVLFISKRAASGEGARRDFDIWTVDRTAGAWMAPRRFEAPINTDYDERHPTVDRDGTLYFASNRPGSHGMDIYRAALAAGGYQSAERLDLNSPGTDTDPAISPDGRTLVFVSVGRPDEPVPPRIPYARGDLYVSSAIDGKWTPARRLPDGINTVAAELAPSFSADGARLLFSSERGFAMWPPDRRWSFRELRDGIRGVMNGLGNIYEVSTAALEVRE